MAENVLKLGRPYIAENIKSGEKVHYKTLAKGTPFAERAFMHHIQTLGLYEMVRCSVALVARAHSHTHARTHTHTQRGGERLAAVNPCLNQYSADNVRVPRQVLTGLGRAEEARAAHSDLEALLHSVYIMDSKDKRNLEQVVGRNLWGKYAASILPRVPATDATTKTAADAPQRFWSDAQPAGPKLSQCRREIESVRKIPVYASDFYTFVLAWPSASHSLAGNRHAHRRRRAPGRTKPQSH